MSGSAMRLGGAAWAVLGIGLCLLGLLLGTQLPVAIYPEVAYPRAVVVASLPGQPAETLDVTVTRPIEEVLSAVPGVKRVRGNTIRGAAEISVLFDPSTDVEVGFQRMNAQLAGLQRELPQGTTWTSERITAASMPVVSFALIGGSSPSVLRDTALYQLRPRLAGLEGVGRISVVGGDEREIEIAVDPRRLAAHHLSLSQVAARIRAALVLESVGQLTVAEREQAILVRGALDGPAALENLAVGTNDSPVLLGQVADVFEGHADRVALTSSQGQSAVVVNVGRRFGADAVQLSNSVQRVLREAQPGLATGVRWLVTYDQADLIAPAITGVRDAILIGAVLAVLMLGLFLRNWRATLLGALSLPITLSLTLLGMALAKESLNLMTLGGLAVAIGILVDDAVVVVEAIERKRSEGLAVTAAVAQAMAEIRTPVISSTATTVVVLLPLALLSGVPGQFFRALSFTLGSAVVLSLATALIAVPLLAGRLDRREAPRHSALTEQYRSGLRWSLQRPRFALLVSGVVLVLGILAALHLPTSFLPAMNEGSYVIDFRAPAGTSLAETDALGTKIDELLLSTPYVRGFARRVGAELGPPAATQSFLGDVSVRLKPSAPSFERIAEDQRAALARSVPQLQLEFVQVVEDNLSDLEGQPQPIEVKIFGSDPERLRLAAADVSSRIGPIAGLTDLYDGDPGCVAQVDVSVKQQAVDRLGLSARDVSDQLQIGLSGALVGRQPYQDRLLDVRLRLADEFRYQPFALEELRVQVPTGPALPLSSLTELHRHCPPARLSSENQRRMVAVTGRLENGNLGGVAADVRARLAGMTLPAGFWWELGGQSLAQRHAFRELAMALGLALFGLLTVLVIHFRSIGLAAILLAAVPVALACGALALFVTRVPFNISSFLGGLVLAGLVVKNGLLLLDRAETERQRGLSPSEALLSAASTRLRPIAMTTLATLLGLLPLALGLGAGAEIQRPLAVVVLGGLAFSSLVTLFALPSLYLFWSRAVGEHSTR